MGSVYRVASCKIMFFGGHFLFFFFIWSSLKLQSLGLFEEVVHNKKKNNKNRSGVPIWDQFLFLIQKPKAPERAAAQCCFVDSYVYKVRLR